MKFIITDVDGVLLNWYDSFYYWMVNECGITPIKNHDATNPDYSLVSYFDASLNIERYINKFNTSKHVRSLSPMPDAVKYFNKLRLDNGYKFIAVSSRIIGDYGSEWQDVKNSVSVASYHSQLNYALSINFDNGRYGQYGCNGDLINNFHSILVANDKIGKRMYLEQIHDTLQYSGHDVYYIDDVFKNVMDGVSDLSFKGIHYKTNKDDGPVSYGGKVTSADSWSDIYDIIVGA